MDDFNIDSILDGSTEESNTSNVGTNQNSSDALKDDRRKLITSIVKCALLGVCFSFMIFLLVLGLYTKYIRFPEAEEVVYEDTGAYALDVYESKINKQDSVDGNNYLLQELNYANSNELKLDFIKKVVNTVDYTPKMVNAKNVYGNDLIDKDTLGVVIIPSYVSEGEAVDFSYIDYSSIKFDEGILKAEIDKYGLEANDVTYSDILVDMFCDYICNLSEVPIKTISRVPNMKYVGGNYAVMPEEDIYLDTILFSSDEFKDCQTRFSEMVGYLLTGNILSPSTDWVNWCRLSDEAKSMTDEPPKYGKMSIRYDWCGAYSLQNSTSKSLTGDSDTDDSVKPELGDGTFNNPADLNTPIVTYVLEEDTDSDDGVVEIPIKVELKEFGVSEDALDWFQSKHIQNRGYNLESRVQYYYGVFEVTNLSQDTIMIVDNSTLCDKNGNISSRTGTVFGLIEDVTLQPDETGCIETWGSSTELNRKYLIWGCDFEKRIEPVWFRVLAGDLEDTSYNKGVYLIDTDSD